MRGFRSLSLIVVLLACGAFYVGGAPLHGDDTAAAVSAAATSTDASPGNDVSDEGDGVAKGNDVFILYSVNNVGFIDVCGCKKKKVRQGSVARRASLVKQLNGRGKHVVAIDGGNTLFNEADRKAQPHERSQLVEKAKVLVESYNRMKYRVMAVGHGEFAMGYEVLRSLEKMADFPFISCNLVSKAQGGKLLFEPFVEFEENGVKIGILGISLVTIPEPFMDKDAPGLEVRLLDGITEANKYLPGLRERNDLVIVMSQNDVDYNRRLLEETEGIDVLVDPFIKMGSYTKWVKEEEGELIIHFEDSFVVRTDAQGARVGTLDMTVFPKGNPIVNRQEAKAPQGRTSFDFERISIEPHLLNDPDVQALVDKFRTGTKFVDLEELPPLPNKDQYLTVSTCQACHAEQYEWWKNTKHAVAFASLEATGDQWRQDCIACHVVGYGQAFLAPADAEPYKNVQCESCHGLNAKHPTDPAQHQWPRIEEASCLQCHNKEQTRTEFNFYSSRRQVACPPMKRP